MTLRTFLVSLRIPAVLIAALTSVKVAAFTAVLEPPVTTAPGPTTAVGGTATVTLAEALGIGVVVGGIVGVLVGVTLRWWRRPPRQCRKCRCVRLPLNPPTNPPELAPDDLHGTIDTGVTPIQEFMCRYSCICDTAGIRTNHVTWMTFPPPPVTSCPERLTIEICWRGSAIEPPRITIE